MANKKIRVEFRKNRNKPPRANDITVQFQGDAAEAGDAQSGERVRAKGDISRHRTIIQDDAGEPMPSMKEGGEARVGRVLRVQGLHSMVELDDGSVVRCGVRRLLKSLLTDERSIVTTGDLVTIRLADQVGEGMIEAQEVVGPVESDPLLEAQAPAGEDSIAHSFESGVAESGLLEGYRH